MKEVIIRWLQFLWPAYRRFDRIQPSWVRYALMFSLGSVLTVFVGIVDTRGDAVKVYLALVGLIVTGTASFVSGRLINEYADRRTVSRQRHAAILRMRSLSSEIRDAIELADKHHPRRLQLENATDSEVKAICWIMDSVVSAAEDLPDFDFVSDADGLSSAHLVIGTFGSVGRIVSPLRGLDASDEGALEARRGLVSSLLTDETRITLERHARSIDSGVRYLVLREKLEELGGSLPKELERSTYFE